MSFPQDSPELQGTKEARLSGDEHMAVVEEFCMAIKDKWPYALIQFEDFQTDHAFEILDRCAIDPSCTMEEVFELHCRLKMKKLYLQKRQFSHWSTPMMSPRVPRTLELFLLAVA